jgi:adenosylcobinamide kinase / adenosylcobinamide-phosphate guanylyltransferase
MLWGFFVHEVSTMAHIIFVLGGARSGKSSYALSRANELSGSKVYIATAQVYADDVEMVDRIEKHKKVRGSDWNTFEEPIRLGQTIRSVTAEHDIVIVDCLTVWLSNLLCTSKDMFTEADDFLQSLRTITGSSCLFIVSNEVGLGIVPENALARQFRDIAGNMNQQVARIAHEVFLVTAGIPVKIK